MRTFKKIFSRTLIVILVLIAAIACYIKFFLPNVGEATEMTVEATPERIARGEYLANHVTVCIDCHSSRDWSRFSGPIVEGTEGMGGDVFDQRLGFPGSFYAKNITPEGIGRYTDGELFRVITTGVSKEGDALFPIMPYHYYGQLDEEDIKSIIAYIRQLKPIRNEVPASKADFPMNFIINTIPAKAKLAKRPAESDVVNYGKYLVTASSCIECHTPVNKGKIIPGEEFSGGREFPLPDGTIIRSSNITPDKATGIGTITEDQFVATFRSKSDSATLARKMQPGEPNTIMPWTMYGSMKEEDLKAIYAYLRTIPAISKQVEKVSLPTTKK